MAKYVLMNKDTEVIVVEQDDKTYQFIAVVELINTAYAPFVIKNAMDCFPKKTLDKLNQWFRYRIIPNSRENKYELLKDIDVESSEELANKHFALSLSDQYWLKPIHSSITWKNINYFTNDYDSHEFFDANYGNNAYITLTKKVIATLSSLETPNNTTGGQLKKAWIKINGENYLYKASASLYNFDPINEVIASMICEILEVPYIPYELKTIQNKRQNTLVSVCKCIINENQEIIPAYELIEHNQKLSESYHDYDIYLDELKKHDIPRAEEYLQKMFMLDYIMLNEDRHLTNFGIIRNVETLEWESICPIFDTGRSNNTNISESYWDWNEGEVKCFTDHFITSEILLELFTIPLRTEQFEKLKAVCQEFKHLLFQYQTYTKLFDEQIEKIAKGFETRMELFYRKMREKGLLIEE